MKMGDLERAERCIDELIDHAGKHSLIPYYAFGLCSKGSLMAVRGDNASGERWLRSGLERTREVAYYLFYAFFLGELAEVLASAGRSDEGLAEVDAALRYAEESQSLWCMPEVLRIKGEILAKREMHKTILDVAPKKGKKMVAGYHSHVLSDEPEDTDVLHVLQQDPPLSEMVATQHFLYEVASDGTIRIKKQKK